MNIEEAMKAMIILRMSYLPVSENVLDKYFRRQLRASGKKPNPKKVDALVNAFTHLQKVLKGMAINKRHINNISEKETLYEHYEQCPTCKGHRYTFFIRTTGTKMCPACEGKGYTTLRCEECDENGMFYSKSGRVVTCRSCKGTKILRQMICRRCKGEKTVPYRIKIKNVCKTCQGAGKIGIDVFNPVLPNKDIIANLNIKGETNEKGA